MAIQNYYTVLQQENISPEEWLFTVRLNPDCGIYKGHFPNQPVAPGVCQLQIVKDCAETALGEQLRITRIKQCKFLRIIIPSEDTTLDIYLRIGTDNTLHAEVRDANTIYVKIKAQLEKL